MLCSAGAVVLARRSPQDDVLVRTARLLDLAPEPCASLTELQHCLGTAHADALRDIAIDLSWLPFPPVDPVEHILSLRKQGVRDDDLSMPRRFARLSFGTKAELEQRITALVAEPEEHRALAREIRGDVLEFFSYERGARELVQCVRERLAERGE